eukprot:7074927-Prorocentrum_lima.AAC.1
MRRSVLPAHVLLRVSSCVHPIRLVVSGAGMEHGRLVELAQKYIEPKLPKASPKASPRPRS